MERNRYYNKRRLHAAQSNCNNENIFTNTNAQYITANCPCNDKSISDKPINPSTCILTKPTTECLLDSSYFNGNTPCEQPQAAYTMGDSSCCCNWGLIPNKSINPSSCVLPGPPPPPPSEGPYGCNLDNTCQLMTTGGMYGRDCNGSTCATSLARCNVTSKICEPAPSDATGDNIYPWATCDSLCSMTRYECASNNTCQVSTTGTYTSNEDCMAKSPCGIVPRYECGSNNTCAISTTGTYTSNEDCMAKSPCGKTTLNIHMMPFNVFKPPNSSYSNPQYVYMWIDKPFTSYTTQGKLQLGNPQLTSINLQKGSGPDALVLEYVIVAFGNVAMNQADPDTQGRMGYIPVPGIPVSNIPIIYNVVSTYPGYAMVFGKQGTKRNATYQSTNYGSFATSPLLNFHFLTIPGKTYRLAARIAYASDDQADGFFCGGSIYV